MTDRLLYIGEAAERVWRRPATVRWWVHRGYLTPYAVDGRGRQLFLERDVLECERACRRRGAGQTRAQAPTSGS